MFLKERPSLIKTSVLMYVPLLVRELLFGMLDLLFTIGIKMKRQY
jgi:hypothetical protein